ncbi:Gti1/Pac2 family-domain-containing protein [Lipomyces arxii]|uniref:Gti1/Pac2 family-domain-containing protein n=1 Tax=Lipomyces arxii TaxID=56418 RepID=UPI0034CE41CF
MRRQPTSRRSMSSMETYYGHVKTPLDAIILFEACRLGVLPRVQRRLSEKERLAIRSGSIFAWDEREAGMRRWTDGKSWSASRVSGSFLTYREMEGKRGGGTYGGPLIPSPPHRSPSMQEEDDDSDRGDDGPDGYRYKPDGLMKQSFSIQTSSHLKLHLISYYSRSHVQQTNELLQPSNDPALKFIRIPKGMYPDATSAEAEPMPISHGEHPYSHNSHPGSYPHQTQRSVYNQPYNPPLQSAPLAQYPVQPYYPPPQMQQHRQVSMTPQMAPQAPQHAPPPPTAPQQQQQQQPQAVHMQQPPSLARPPAPQRQHHQHSMLQPQPAQLQQPMLGQPQYVWPLSPASTPPNYSMHSASPHPDHMRAQSQPRPYQPPPQMQSLPIQVAQSQSMQQPPLIQQMAPQPSAPQPPPLSQQFQQQAQSAAPLPSLHTLQQQIPRQMQTGDRPQYSASRIEELTARDLAVQDIPFEKVSWGEDTRAIDQLNKGFSI